MDTSHRYTRKETVSVKVTGIQTDWLTESYYTVCFTENLTIVTATCSPDFKRCFNRGNGTPIQPQLTVH